MKLIRFIIGTILITMLASCASSQKAEPHEDSTAICKAIIDATCDFKVKNDRWPQDSDELKKFITSNHYPFDESDFDKYAKVTVDNADRPILFINQSPIKGHTGYQTISLINE